MKLQVCLALVLLIAVANVFGQESVERGSGRSNWSGSRRNPTSENGNPRPFPMEGETRPRPMEGETRPRPMEGETRPRPLEGETRPRPMEGETRPRPMEEETRPRPMEGETRPRPLEGETRPRPMEGETRPRPMETETRPPFGDIRNDREKLTSEKTTSFEQEHSKFDASDVKASSSKEKVHFEGKNGRLGDSTRFSNQKEESSVSESRVSSENKSTKFSSTSTEERLGEHGRDRLAFENDHRFPIEETTRRPWTGSRDEFSSGQHFSKDDFRGSSKETSSEFIEGSGSRVPRPGTVIMPPAPKPSEYEIFLDNRVHVTGSILLARKSRPVVDSVEYEVKGGRWNKPKLDLIKPRFNDELNTIDPNSHIVLYVSTLNSYDVREAFTNFTIPYSGTAFPLDFNVEIILPEPFRRLLQTEDLKLYFFAYVYNAEPRFESFVPEGTCQILLQGTTRVVQRVEVFVQANGLHLSGVFHGFYGEKFIKPGTSFQILIISEDLTHRFIGNKVDYAAQIIVTDVPAMYPLTFSGVVPHRRLKNGIRYYAIAYMFEDGFERLLTPIPILVINENRVVVTNDLSIKVTPYPFILYGTITRSMPGNYYFEPESSIILNFFQVDAQLPPIVFRLPSIPKLPQDIQVNLSQALKFDPTKRYEILASVADRNNEIYMTSSQRLLLDITSTRFTIPVEDLYYHVRVNFRTSVNQQLTFIRESTATLFVTETPEATRAPLFKVQFDPSGIRSDGYLLRMPIRSVARVPSAYLILLINNTGIITHVSKVLFISNFQPPSLNLDLPVIPLNLLRGQITEFDANLPQWSSWAYANIYLLDDRIENPEKAIVQSWKIYLEREFPINFEVHLDFSQLIPGHSYSLRSDIETRPGVFEYRAANTIRVIEPERPIQDNVHLMVKSVKVSHFINGIVYLDSVQQYLVKHGEVVVYLSSNQILTKPDIIFQTRIPAELKTTMVNFAMEIPLDRIDMNGIYYFLIQYVSSGEVVIAPSQVFSYTPRNGAAVILRLSKSEQIQVTGEVVSTGGPLILPEGSNLLLQIADTQFGSDPRIYSEVVLPATPTNMYRFTMYFDSVMVPRNATVFLRAAVMYKDRTILSMPRPAPIQIQRNVVWNIALTVDLPTLLIGQISLVGEKFSLSGDYDAYVQILIGGTETVISSSRVRMGTVWPQPIRVEVDNKFFVEHRYLETRALIKNCKEETIFRSVSSVQIHSRLNLDLDLQIVPQDTSLLKKLTNEVRVETNVGEGFWAVSLRGTSSFDVDRAVPATLDANLSPVF